MTELGNQFYILDNDDRASNDFKEIQIYMAILCLLLRVMTLLVRHQVLGSAKIPGDTPVAHKIRFSAKLESWAYGARDFRSDPQNCNERRQVIHFVGDVCSSVPGY